MGDQLHIAIKLNNKKTFLFVQVTLNFFTEPYLSWLITGPHFIIDYRNVYFVIVIGRKHIDFINKIKGEIIL